MAMKSKDIKRWGISKGISDDLLAECLWHYEKSLTGSTEAINWWVTHGGPRNFAALEEVQMTLTQTIEWRKAQRVLIASRWSKTTECGKKLVKMLYDWDSGSTMALEQLIANRRAVLKEFGDYTPETPPAPAGAYLHRGDPMDQYVSPQDEQELMAFEMEQWPGQSQDSAS